MVRRDMVIHRMLPVPSVRRKRSNESGILGADDGLKRCIQSHYRICKCFDLQSHSALDGFEQRFKTSAQPGMALRYPALYFGYAQHIVAGVENN